MSILDSGINSLSSVVTTDFYRRLWKKDPDPKHELTIARTTTLGAGLFAIVTCLLLELIPEDQRGNLFDITGRVSSFLVGSLGGMMFVAILRIRCPGPVVIAAALVGMTVGLIWAQGHWLFGLQELAWMWVIPVSSLVTLVTAMVLARLFPASQSGSPTWYGLALKCFSPA